MDLDIVIPAHNEAARIDPTLELYRKHCWDPRTRFHIAMDGCTDGTADVVRRHAAEDPRVRLVEYPKLGKGGALAETFRQCRGELVAFVDADCATPPAELLRLLDAARHADVVLASRWHPTAVLPAARPHARRVASAGFALLVRRLFNLPYADTQCGAKVFRRTALQRVLPLLSTRGFLFDVDVLARARDLGLDVVEVPTVWIDRDGSHLQLRRDIKRMLLAAFALWLGHRSDPVPSAVVATEAGVGPADAQPAVIDLTDVEPPRVVA